MSIPEKVRAILERHGLEALVFEPGSTPTVSAAAAKIGVAPGQIAKSLLFKGKSGDYHMVVCAGDRRISSSRLKALIGSKPGMTSPEETELMTGFLPGGVCPFGLEGIPVWIDTSLEGYPVVYPAAGTDGSGVPTDFQSLLNITGGKPCSVAD